MRAAQHLDAGTLLVDLELVETLVADVDGAFLDDEQDGRAARGGVLHSVTGQKMVDVSQRRTLQRQSSKKAAN